METITRYYGSFFVRISVFIITLEGLSRSAILQGNAATLSSDVSALLALKSAMGDPPVLESWQPGSDPCINRWAGVSPCSTRILRLALASLKLSGQIPEEIGSLTALISLDLSLNRELTGPLPATMGNLVKLEVLNLQSCSFSGLLPPELGHLSKLAYLILGDNNFQGSIPAAWSALRNMIYFSISKNTLSGPIPVSPGIDNWPRVLHLHMSYNDLTTLPPELGTLQHVIHILLDNNNLTGRIPVELGNCSSLQILQLSNNTLEGGIPSELTKLPKLNQLRLSNCSLDGEVPSLAPLINLESLDLSKNNFSGPFPPAIGNELVKLQCINLGYNDFNGPLPPTLKNLSGLQLLNVVNNELNGEVPDLSKLVLLTEVSLANNKLGGPIPDALVDRQPAILWATGNPLCFRHLTAPLQVACNLPISVPPPSWIAPNICPKLRCRKNESPNPFLVYSTSERGCHCSQPLSAVLVFSNPPFFNFTDVLAFQLRELFFKRLRACVPAVNSISQVWISWANWSSSGMILGLQLFDSSSNPWSVEMAVEAYLQLSSKRDLLWPSYGPFFVQNFSTSGIGSEERHLSNIAVALIVTGSVLAVAALFAALFLGLLQRLRRTCNQLRSRHLSSSWALKECDLEGLDLKGVRMFKLEELRAATCNFSTCIGEGGYRTVYKGELGKGELAAIKRAKPCSRQGGMEFRNEIELLSGVHHRNLVSLLGFCKEDGEELLVYEYVPRGTLHQHLHGKESADRPLTWRQRICIAMGSARGLAYLHNDIHPPIIHRDIKSRNILVDERWGGKVADFGLSKLAPESDDSVQGVDTRVKGTTGYMDPEYFLTDRLTHKSDVYSFGVVLLEMVTGRQPVTNNEHIVRVVNAEIRTGGLALIVDPKMCPDSLKAVESLVHLALRCVHRDPDYRPSMFDVCASLDTIHSMQTGAGENSVDLPSGSGREWSTPGQVTSDRTIIFESISEQVSDWSSHQEFMDGMESMPQYSPCMEGDSGVDPNVNFGHSFDIEQSNVKPK